MHGSYLQGMETSQPMPLFQTLSVCSTDPTYKEWKHIVGCGCVKLFAICTDPTYKEWKRKLSASGRKTTICTDPTYKEWKPQPHPCHLCWGLSARILPTRNGNAGKLALRRQTEVGTDPTYKEWKLLRLDFGRVFGSCTDPTYKEWKRPDNDFGVYRSEERHGSYLQGMETRRNDYLAPSGAIARILPTRNGN